MQIGILEPLGFSPDALATLARLGAVHQWNGENLGAFLGPLDVLFVRLGHRIDRKLLEMAPRLRWLCSPTTGHLHLDEEALAARGITLVSLRGERDFLETVRATPEHTFGLILALLRRYRQAFADTLDGRWDRDRFKGEELSGNRVGIIGLGRVGHRVASYCTSFGATVAWYDPADVTADPGWIRAADIASLIDASRIVVLCASIRAGEPAILGSAEIRRLGGRYLVNTARGELVDELALLAAIRAGLPAGVAVDVIADELGMNRLEQWREVARERNVILTPHIGGATAEAMARTERFIADKLARNVAAQEASV